VTAATDTSRRDHVHHLLRTYVSERPVIYLPFARRKYPGPSPNVIAADTELVIDGYTRCASTFAVYAFQMAQPRSVRLAHHLHAPAQLIAAARAGVPALVLIRAPEGAVSSQVVREPGVSLADGLWSYARFYETLAPFRSSFVVADFDEVTGDFGAVTRRLNEQAGTSYAEFDHTEANVRACLDLIVYRPTLSTTLLGFESGTATLAAARREVERLAEASVRATDTWVPSQRRRRDSDAIRARLRTPELRARLARARTAYEAFCD
jgi:hypothetical protein